MLTASVSGTRNLFLSQEHSEQKPINRWLSLIRRSATVIPKIHLKSQSQCALWETSRIRLNIALNGAETISILYSLIELLMHKCSLRAHRLLLSNSAPTQLPLEWRINFKTSRTWSRLRKARTSQIASKSRRIFLKLNLIMISAIWSLYSQLTIKILMGSHSGLDQRDAPLQSLLMLMILYMFHSYSIALTSSLQLSVSSQLEMKQRWLKWQLQLQTKHI
jgi:hypothetical protein